MSAHSETRQGRFGRFGGQYVPETLMPCLQELTDAYEAARLDPDFQTELQHLLHHYSGRPTPLYLAESLGRRWKSTVPIYLKREDLNHTGAHKINNCLGQVLLTQRMGKARIVAETGAGQHGVATATVAARANLACTIYMGELDISRQRPNVRRMELLGAEIRPVGTGSRTLKDATSEAIRDWVTNVETTHYILGSTVGPHPYPMIVRELQAVIGDETRRQILDQTGSLPAHIIACVGGGSNAMGIFAAFLEDESVSLWGVEAGGSSSAGGAAALCEGTPGVLHGSYSYLLQTPEGQVKLAHSLAPGLDYPGTGPEHSFLKECGRVTYTQVSDDQALSAFKTLTRSEGILPALESSHAIAYGKRLSEHIAAGGEAAGPIIINLSGRGDKDMESVEEMLKS
jgi:tryptophan synthase beta chain